MLCCSSCYYLDGATTWASVRDELTRVVKPGGLLFAGFPDSDNAVLRDAQRQPDGSRLFTSDPFLVRNGGRFMVSDSGQDTAALLPARFETIATARLADNFFGLRVFGHVAVARRSS